MVVKKTDKLGSCWSEEGKAFGVHECDCSGKDLVSEDFVLPEKEVPTEAESMALFEKQKEASYQQYLKAHPEDRPDYPRRPIGKTYTDPANCIFGCSIKVRYVSEYSDFFDSTRDYPKNLPRELDSENIHNCTGTLEGIVNCMQRRIELQEKKVITLRKQIKETAQNSYARMALGL
ncbi:MAG: hypothetical protein DLM72_01970 [Candidatus Nitrosopolaris wilkensis]|nr:MAG: hypothetical protein DLM72_01970 [Candidatus Nitrosopolaris wilkensis]